MLMPASATGSRCQLLLHTVRVMVSESLRKCIMQWAGTVRQYRGYQSFGPMAQCVVHALKGLACRASPSSAR